MCNALYALVLSKQTSFK